MQSKTVGKRRPTTDFEAIGEFLKTAIRLRGNRPFIPRGVYRFKTHEEAQAWSLKMMTRRKN